MFEKILVCLDGSDLAEQILPYVMEQALRFGSKVELLRVVTMPSTGIPAAAAGAGAGTPPDYTAAGTGSYTAELMREQVEREENEAKTYLDHVTKQLHEKGLDVDWVIGQGTPGEAIVKYAHESEVGFIAITTHGHSGLKRAIFGSVADYVLRESGLPMLVIKPEEVES